LRTRIDYALANTALALGHIPEDISSYDACLASTEGGTALDAVRLDAAINRRFALEQAQSLAIPQDQNSGDQPQSRRPDRRRAPNRRGGGDDQTPEGQPESDPESGGTGPDASEQGDRPPTGRRRIGGAGGSRSSPAGARGDSPQDHLDAAIEQINAAEPAAPRRNPHPPPRTTTARIGRRRLYRVPPPLATNVRPAGANPTRSGREVLSCPSLTSPSLSERLLRSRALAWRAAPCHREHG